MYKRFELAVEATKTNELLKLSTMLNEAVIECLAQSVPPFTDPAIMLMCYQISFAGNGDFPDGAYYRKMLQFCEDKATSPLKEMKFEPPNPNA